MKKFKMRDLIKWGVCERNFVKGKSYKLSFDNLVSGTSAVNIFPGDLRVAGRFSFELIGGERW